MEEKYICEFCNKQYNISNKIPHRIDCEKKFGKNKKSILNLQKNLKNNQINNKIGISKEKGKNDICFEQKKKFQ